MTRYQVGVMVTGEGSDKRLLVSASFGRELSRGRCWPSPMMRSRSNFPGRRTIGHPVESWPNFMVFECLPRSIILAILRAFANDTDVARCGRTPKTGARVLDKLPTLALSAPFALNGRAGCVSE